MEKIGVYFEVPTDGGYNLRIENILELFINMENYNWHTTENSGLARINNDWADYDLLHDKGFDIGSNLKEELKGIDYYPIFLNLRAYPQEVPILEIENTPINTIPEFLNSTCSLMFVIIDCYEIGIFTKNIEDLQKIQQEIVSQGYENVRLIDKAENWRFS